MTEKKQMTPAVVDKTPTKLSGFESIEEMKEWAETIIESGLLPDSISEPEQVITIVQYGKELGLTPHSALNNLHVIAGRPVISASMLGALLKRAKKEWIITEDFVTIDTADGKSDKRTTYKFYWKSEITGKVMEAEHSITWRQMDVAGYTSKHNWQKYPKEMMRARCLSSAVRALFPEIFLGLYTDLEINDIAEEMGGEAMEVELTEDGSVTLVPNEEVED
jgi:hypothetical protein